MKSFPKTFVVNKVPFFSATFAATKRLGDMFISGGLTLHSDSFNLSGEVQAAGKIIQCNSVCARILSQA